MALPPTHSPTQEPTSSLSSCSSSTTSTTPAKPSIRHAHLLARQQSLQSTLSALRVERNALVLSTLSSAAPPSIPADSKVAISSSFKKDEKEEEEDEIDTTEPSTEQITLALALSNQKIKQHIKTLQQYNEIKDIGTQLMGMIAEKRGVRIVEVQRGFGVGCDD